MPIVIFLIGSCFVLKSFAKEITAEFRLLDADVETKQSERIMTENFCNAVQFFADAKQLSAPIRPSKI